MNLRTILVTGGCGFLGQYLIRGLLDEFPDTQLRIIDLNDNPHALFDFSSDARVEIRLGIDIRDLPALREACQGIDGVIHLAGLVSFALKDEALLERVNVLGTRNVLTAAHEKGVDCFVHVSSVAALGYSDDPHQHVDESFQFNWSEAQSKKKFYMLSKHRADREVEALREAGLSAVIVYPGLMFGPGDYRNTAPLIRAVGKGRVPFFPPGGTNVVDVRDVAGGIIAVLRHDIRQGNYLLSGWNLTMKEITAIIAGATGSKAPWLPLPRFLRPVLYRLALMLELGLGRWLNISASSIDSAFRFRYFDHARARERLGWAPAIPFHQTVSDTITWMRSAGLA